MASSNSEKNFLNIFYNFDLKENAILKNRELMGNTNPQEAEPGTIRSDFAQSIDANAVHGSDSVESAKREIAYFFNDSEIF